MSEYLTLTFKRKVLLKRVALRKLANRLRRLARHSFFFCPELNDHGWHFHGTVRVLPTYRNEFLTFVHVWRRHEGFIRISPGYPNSSDLAWWIYCHKANIENGLVRLTTSNYERYQTKPARLTIDDYLLGDGRAIYKSKPLFDIY